jgi:hypothetical protein
MGANPVCGINFLWERASSAPSVEHCVWFWRGGCFAISRLEIICENASISSGRPVLTDLADILNSIRRAEIVLLEENEPVIFTMRQVQDLRNAAATLE